MTNELRNATTPSHRNTFVSVAHALDISNPTQNTPVRRLAESRPPELPAE
jgi:hypothetical protein